METSCPYYPPATHHETHPGPGIRIEESRPTQRGHPGRKEREPVALVLRYGSANERM
jgi:hypothetical protein